MRCRKCNKFFSDMLDRCPFCHAPKDFGENNLEIKLKDGTVSKIPLDKTMAINTQDIVKEEKKTILDHSKQDEVLIVDDSIMQEESILDDITSDSSISARKRTLFISAGIVGCIIFIIAASLLLIPKKSSNEYDYLKELETGIQIYSKGEKTDRIQKVLEYVVDDPMKTSLVQKKSKELLDKYLVSYRDDEIDNSEAFAKEKDSYKKFINDLNDVYVKKDNDIIRVFNNDDYESLLKDVDNIYNDGKSYYAAIDYYHSRDYNKAYALFNKVDKDNMYYDKASEKMTGIVNSILDILNDDIKKIELDNDKLSDEQLLKQSAQIVDIIIGYDSVYKNVGLKNNSTYKSLLEEYNSRVKNYSKIIADKKKKK